MSHPVELIRKMAGKATSGLFVSVDKQTSEYLISKDDWTIRLPAKNGTHSFDDAVFLAHAKAYVLSLLADMDHLKARLEHAEKLADRALKVINTLRDGTYCTCCGTAKPKHAVDCALVLTLEEDDDGECEG